jgi:hypothetical protein
MPVEDLRQSEMMSHLLDALDKGEDIGHYGRLTFAMVAHHFLDKEELVEWLSKDGDTDESGLGPSCSRSRRGATTRPGASASSSGRISRSSPSVRTPTIRMPVTSTGSWTSRMRSSRTSRIIVKTGPPERRNEDDLA